MIVFLSFLSFAGKVNKGGPSGQIFIMYTEYRQIYI
jgi:hypothetical protein